MHWRGLVDSLVLALVIYLVLRWGREARAFRVSLAIVGLRVGAVVARQLGLSLTVWVLDGATLAAVIVILIVFQAELRRALVRLDVMAWLLPRPASTVERSLQAIATAAFSLAHARRGALIVIAGNEPLDELVEGGVPLGGAISTEILEAIFRKVSPVHDGATIIEGDHIARVSALLPLTQRRDVPRHYGTRHRAAMGLAERSDALVIVVSEERGEVSLASGRDMVVLQTPNALMQAIRQQREPGPIGRTRRLRQVLLGDLALKAVALGLAALVWASSVLLTGGSVRSVTVPVELSNVPADLEVSSLSTQTLQAQLRGPAWILESANLTTLVARFDLAGAGEGPLTLNVRGASVNFPPGVVLESVIPQTLSLRLVRRSQTPVPR
jgi:diadenylate cyclase